MKVKDLAEKKFSDKEEKDISSILLYRHEEISKALEKVLLSPKHKELNKVSRLC